MADSGMGAVAQPRVGVRLQAGQPIARLVEQARVAERLGFSTVWLDDDVTTGPDVYPTLAACARATSAIRLAVGVTNTVTRHPTVTSCALVTLDEAYPGRFALGIGRRADVVRAQGEQPATPEQFAADVALLRRIMDGEVVDYRGKRVQTRFADRARPRRVALYVLAEDDADTAALDAADGAILRGGVPLPDRARRVVRWLDGERPTREQVAGTAGVAVDEVVVAAGPDDLGSLAQALLG